MNNLTHTIAAVSTPPGKGGVAIIRISGEGAFDIADKVFSPVNSGKLSECQARKRINGKIPSEGAPRTALFGEIVDPDSGKRIDTGLYTRFAAPNSFTGEDTVEIACHGGILVTALVLEAILKAGAMPAGAGEFTRRAFVNGRLSLSEAEAISNLLDARSREQIRLSSSDSRSALSEKINKIRTELLDLMSSIYARIDYPDEDLGDFTNEESAEILSGTDYPPEWYFVQTTPFQKLSLPATLFLLPLSHHSRKFRLGTFIVAHRHIDGAGGEIFPPEVLSGHSDGLHLSVSGRVLQEFVQVMGTGDDGSFAYHHRPDRDLPLFAGLDPLFQGLTHIFFVRLGSHIVLKKQNIYHCTRSIAKECYPREFFQVIDKGDFLHTHHSDT